MIAQEGGVGVLFDGLWVAVDDLDETEGLADAGLDVGIHCVPNPSRNSAACRSRLAATRRSRGSFIGSIWPK